MSCQGASAEMGTSVRSAFQHKSFYSNRYPIISSDLRNKKALFVAARFIIDNQMNPVKNRRSYRKATARDTTHFQEKTHQKYRKKYSILYLLEKYDFLSFILTRNSFIQNPKKSPNRKILSGYALLPKRLLLAREGVFFYFLGSMGLA